MTKNVVTLPWMDLHFGNCPECHKTHGCHSVGRDHWHVCHTHHTKWWIGSNLFSCWRDLSEQQMRANAYMLSGYREVKPWLPHDVKERLEQEFCANRELLRGAPSETGDQTGVEPINNGAKLAP